MITRIYNMPVAIFSIFAKGVMLLLSPNPSWRVSFMNTQNHKATKNIVGEMYY